MVPVPTRCQARDRESATRSAAPSKLLQLALSQPKVQDAEEDKGEGGIEDIAMLRVIKVNSRSIQCPRHCTILSSYKQAWDLMSIDTTKESTSNDEKGISELISASNTPTKAKNCSINSFNSILHK